MHFPVKSTTMLIQEHPSGQFQNLVSARRYVKVFGNVEVKGGETFPFAPSFGNPAGFSAGDPGSAPVKPGDDPLQPDIIGGKCVEPVNPADNREFCRPSSDPADLHHQAYDLIRILLLPEPVEIQVPCHD
jgi:hypothetical protein